jgi:circadian clock protein KaiC
MTIDRDPARTAPTTQTASTEQRLRIPLLRTGVPNLDTVLGGGLPELSFTVIVGGAGTGKTILAQQILHAIATTERPAIFFSVHGEPILKVLRYQQQFDFFDPARVGRDVFYFDLADDVRSLGADHAIEVIMREVQSHTPAIIAIDSFGAIAELNPTGVTNPRSFAHDLALRLASWDTTSLLIDEFPEEKLPAKPELTIADGIIWLGQQVRQNAVTRKLQVVKMRGLSPLPGRHTFRIDRGGVQVYPRLSPIEDNATIKPEGRAGFDIPPLDAMLRGGIPIGQTCLVAGSSGTGKTLLALHFIMAGARRGEASVMVAFEERPQEHVRKAASFGWDLQTLQDEGQLRMLSLRPVDLSVDEVLGEIQQAVTAIDARRVVINSVSGFELAISVSEKEEFQEGLYRLVANLTNRGITVLLTTEISDLFGNVRITTYGVSFIADNILLMRYAEIDSALHKALAIVKMRTSDHDKELRQYRIDEHGIAVEAAFTEYSGVLTGTPMLRVQAGPQPYTPGLGDQEAALTSALMARREASAEQLAEALGQTETQIQATLDKLVDTGYIVRARHGGVSVYRMGMLSSGTAPRRSSRKPSPE